jgi:aminoglycoside phosphotransferase (APT) family kinase protein
VQKTYEGPDAELRLDREYKLLTWLQGRLPVPRVRAADVGTLTLGFVLGAHGQELLDAGHAAAVLGACGELLRPIHETPASVLAVGAHEARKVLVHGDFGPNNVLLDPVTFQVTAVVDWEFAHLGDPVEDLAWCEWIVRMHHPRHRRALDHFFHAYSGHVLHWQSARPPCWPDARCCGSSANVGNRTVRACSSGGNARPRQRAGVSRRDPQPTVEGEPGCDVTTAARVGRL